MTVEDFAKAFALVAFLAMLLVIAPVLFISFAILSAVCLLFQHPIAAITLVVIAFWLI